MAHIYKDRFETANTPYAKAFYNYKIACVYYMGDQPGKAHRYIKMVLEADASGKDQQSLNLKNLQVEAGRLKVLVEEPDKTFKYELQHFSYFWNKTYQTS